MDDGVISLARHKDQFRKILDHLECGEEEQAGVLLTDIVKANEMGLFQEVGKLTRQLHDTLSAFSTDDRLMNLTQSSIPDAKERLNYVIAMTDQSANRVLAAIEDSVPLSDSILARAGELGERWKKFRQREMSADDFRTLSKELTEFLSITVRDAEKLRGHLREVMLAQDFQDITGQIIRRVITLVQEVEDNLVGLVRITGERMVPEKKADGKPDVKAEGPRVPGVDDVNRVSGQDEVDDLLSSLGF